MKRRTLGINVIFCRFLLKLNEKEEKPEKNDFYSRVSFHQASTKSQAYARFLKLL